MNLMLAPASASAASAVIKMVTQTTTLHRSQVLIFLPEPGSTLDGEEISAQIDLDL